MKMTENDMHSPLWHQALREYVFCVVDGFAR